MDEEKSQSIVVEKVEELKKLNKRLKNWNIYWGILLACAAICEVGRVELYSTNIAFAIVLAGLLFQGNTSRKVIDVVEHLFRESEDTV